MDTKERIVWEALELFSKRGYGAVSVRDIAAAVGIRESSLYNHFRGKRAIFDGIVDICWAKAEEYYHAHGLPFSREEDMSVFESEGPKLEEAVLGVFQFFFEDPWNTRFRRLLTVSQFEDKRAGELYRRLYCQYPVEVQEAVFAVLIEKGVFRAGDPRALAEEFYGRVFLLLCAGDSWESVKPKLAAHIRQFTAAYGKCLKQ